MAGIVALIVKVMPSGLDVEIGKLEKEIKVSLEGEGAQNISFEEKEVAFGLKAVMVKFAWNEEKDTEIVVEVLKKVEGVSAVDIEDYRRAFG